MATVSFISQKRNVGEGVLEHFACAAEAEQQARFYRDLGGYRGLRLITPEGVQQFTRD